MEAFSIMTTTASLVILAGTVWACLSRHVFDGIVLKFFLFFGGVSAYVEAAHPSPRALAAMAMALAGAILVVIFQRYVLGYCIIRKPCQKTKKNQKHKAHPRHARSA